MRTPKGDDYFNHILAPKFYEKYKNLEVEIDDQGNILAVHLSVMSRELGVRVIRFQQKSP